MTVPPSALQQRFLAVNRQRTNETDATSRRHRLGIVRPVDERGSPQDLKGQLTTNGDDQASD